MKNITKWLLGLAIAPVGLVLVSNHAQAGLIASEWFFMTNVYLILHYYLSELTHEKV